MTISTIKCFNSSPHQDLKPGQDIAVKNKSQSKENRLLSSTVKILMNRNERIIRSIQGTYMILGFSIVAFTRFQTRTINVYIY